MVSDYRPLFRNRNFLYLWTSQILSQLTINIMNFLLLIVLFQRTGSTIATSFLWVSYAIPAILVGPFAAAAIDMISRRKALIYTNLLQSLVIFVYSFLHETSTFLLYGVVLLYSLLNQFYVPAEVAALPSLVKRENYAHANSLFFVTQQLALILGYGVAGIMFSVLGFYSSLLICSAFIFIAFIAVIFLPREKAIRLIPNEFEEAVVSFFKHIYEGYRFIKIHRNILFPFLLMIGMQVALSVVVVNTPILAEEIFKVPVNLAGIYLVVPSAIGAFIGANIIPKLLAKGRRKIGIINYALKYITLALFILTFVVTRMKGVYAVALGAMVLVLLGISFVGILVPTQTFLQEKTPKKLRGRVFGNYWFLVSIATIFPVVLSGTIAELFSGQLLLFLLAMAFLTITIFARDHAQDFLVNGMS